MLTHQEIVRIIAEEIEDIELGEVRAGDISGEHLLWSAGPDAPSLNLDSLQVIELIFRVENRTAHSLPPTFDMMLPMTVGQLADQISASSVGSSD